MIIMDLLAKATEWLKDQCQAHLSTDIRYHTKDGGGIIATRATRGLTTFRSTNDYGVTVTIRSIDFIIPSNDLGIKPQTGDIIECSNRCYEVLAPNNEPVWRWVGSYHESMRIHTKYVGTIND